MSLNDEVRQDDVRYLKDYVKRHPDNKMAWYLLGKEYSSKGEQGKAAYCYVQAAEVYEAFESRPMVLPAPEIGSGILRKNAGRNSRFETFRRVLLPLILLLLCIWIPADRNMERKETAGPADGHVPLASGFPQRMAADGAKPAEAAADGIAVYYLSKHLDRREIGLALQDMTLIRNRFAEYFLIAQPSFANGGKWREWPAETRLLMDGEKTAPDQIRLRNLDAELCSCRPEDSAEAEQALASWKKRQEEKAVLRSAILAYMRLNGKMPENIGDLVRPYPHNFLPGYTGYMEQQFARELEELAATPEVRADSQPFEPDVSVPALLNPLFQPLEIIVDKETYRLALVSGTVIVRSYPVGLGGDRTPEGEFAVTEKVRNPNGRSDGDFGSRGMTLSDSLYAIHGTNEPSSIGEDRSLGCIRMLPRDIEELFDMVPLGTKVTVGKGLLPEDPLTKQEPFRLPLMTEEENPRKVYQWLG